MTIVAIALLLWLLPAFVFAGVAVATTPGILPWRRVPDGGAHFEGGAAEREAAKGEAG